MQGHGWLEIGDKIIDPTYCGLALPLPKQLQEHQVMLNGYTSHYGDPVEVQKYFPALRYAPADLPKGKPPFAVSVGFHRINVTHTTCSLRPPMNLWAKMTRNNTMTTDDTINYAERFPKPSAWALKRREAIARGNYPGISTVRAVVGTTRPCPDMSRRLAAIVRLAEEQLAEMGVSDE